MKRNTPLGSRIAEVHNGSSLFTGDAGQGESNIRRWIIENDWLEAIVALPLNMFYNTGIATYVWVLTNRKPKHRRGKVQLIDATKRFQPLRKNLGKKNCELGEEDIDRICGVFLAFEETEESRIFDNEAFGYWKVTVDRPLRIEGIDADRAYKLAEIRELKATGERGEIAPPVIRKVHKPGVAADPPRGLFEAKIDGRTAVVEYEPDTELRDTEQIPLQEEGGIEAFLRREVLPWAPDAWYNPGTVKTGYEISFNRYFYKPEPMRPLAEIQADILALETQTEGLLAEIMGGMAPGPPEGRTRRVYVDTSVFGGYDEDKFREPSRRLFERFRQGELRLVVSPLTIDELNDAPRRIREIIDTVPDDHLDLLPETDEAGRLAAQYIAAGALGPSMRPDGVHIAAATLARVDHLVSWNFKHMVKPWRISIINAVNRRHGHAHLDIRTPRDFKDDE